MNNILRDIELKLNLNITDTHAVNGGSINKVYCLHTTQGKLLLKVNDRYQFPGMFKREQKGLQAIAHTKTIAVPHVILQADIDTDSYLLLAWIDTTPPTKQTSLLLGEQLAAMHRHTAPKFGFDTDNYMGSLSQSNKQYYNWSDFFIMERLQPMVKMAIQKGELSAKDEERFEKLYEKLPGLFNEEQPALIHGDLWGGNYLTGSNGTPYLIDPAVSYGNREFDIAMTTLFGGFDTDFYEAYQAAYPLLPGWQQRISLWNLYPLLVHVNLFGGSYAAQVRHSLDQFI